MNPWTILASALQRLPRSVRRTLYSIVTAAGAVLAMAQIAGWRTIGPIDVDAAMKTYALIASPTGVLALANTAPKEGRDDGPRETYLDDRYADDGDALGPFTPASAEEASFS